MKLFQDLKKGTAELGVHGFRLVAAISCLVILSLGWGIGYLHFSYAACAGNSEAICKNQIEIFKLAIPFLLGLVPGGFLLFVELYIQGLTGKLEDEANRVKKELRELAGDRYRFSPEMDFLSKYYTYLGYHLPPGFDCNDYCLGIQAFSDYQAIDEKLKQYINMRQAEKEVLDGLKKGFVYDHRFDSGPPLARLARDACNYALRLPDAENVDWAKPFYKDIVAYLRAWLPCSIYHGFAIPIIPFMVDDLGEKGKGRYYGKSSYIKAIKYIQRQTLSKTGKTKFLNLLGSQESLDIFNFYLEELRELFEGVTLHNPSTYQEKILHITQEN